MRTILVIALLLCGGGCTRPASTLQARKQACRGHAPAAWAPAAASRRSALLRLRGGRMVGELGGYQYDDDDDPQRCVRAQHMSAWSQGVQAPAHARGPALVVHCTALTRSSLVRAGCCGPLPCSATRRRECPPP